MNEITQSRFIMLLKNVAKALWRGFKKHPVIFVTVIMIMCVLRAYIQPEALYIRKHFFNVLLVVAVGLLIMRWIKRKRLIPILVTAGIVASVSFVVVKFGCEPHYFNTLFAQYHSLDKELLDQMPQTRHERIHPLVSIQTMAGAVVADVEHVVEPHYVKFHDDYCWTLGVEPQFSIRRLSGSINTVFAIPGQATVLDFTGDHEFKVNFTTGEHMFFFKNAAYLARQSFGLFKFWNYEPADLKYVPGPKGELVQILTLTRWKGIIFPKPVFGGVVVFEQDHDGVIGGTFDVITRLFIGKGEFISSDDIQNHDWLVGQNLVSYDVARHIALSFRFHRGYLAPMPFYHLGDVEIPDLPGDMNEQPFTSYFKFDNEIHPDKLYHYFAMEPYRKDRQGLALSILVPSDGIGKMLYADHKDSRMIGVSPVPTLVRDTRKMYDWSNGYVAEQRPFIRDIAGKRRYCYLSTVVTRQTSDSEQKDSSDNRVGAISGMNTEVVLTDALAKRPVWVNNLDPNTWEQQMIDELADHW